MSAYLHGDLRRCHFPRGLHFLVDRVSFPVASGNHLTGRVSHAASAAAAKIDRVEKAGDGLNLFDIKGS